MKKIKIERNNQDTGEAEVVAIEAPVNSSPPNEESGDKNENEGSHESSNYNANNDIRSRSSCASRRDSSSSSSSSSSTTASGGSSASSNSSRLVDESRARTSSPHDANQASINVNVGPADADELPKNSPRQSQAPSPSVTQHQNQTPFPTVQRTLPPGAPANYCNICNKELCNKYFMKTHMQKMHGINLDDYPREAANSGGVVCDICQKELCSKYFLKVHKSNTHGITDFSSGSAGSQAANAATAVAAIALTNYSLNNAQKRAAINLALNQHQLQNRQAAALMNAAAASAAFSSPLQMAQGNRTSPLMQQQQRGQLNTSSLIEHLNQQQHQHQKQQHQHQSQSQHQTSNQPLQATAQQQHHPQPFDLPQIQIQPPTNNLAAAAAAANLHAAIPAALLAATANNPLLAAQLAQHQQQFLQLQQPNGRQPNQTAPHRVNPGTFPFAPNEHDTAPNDVDDDTSDRDSLVDQTSEQLFKNPLSMNNFHQHLQSQHQALLNAVVFNPAAAAAAMMAMQQQQQQQQQQLYRFKQHQQQSPPFAGGRQQTAIDLRNQPFSQILAQQINTARQQEQVVNDCGNNNTAQLQAAQLYEQREGQVSQRLSQLPEPDEEDEADDDFDSDRGSLIDENIFRQTVANAALLAASNSTTIGPAAAVTNTTTTNTINSNNKLARANNISSESNVHPNNGSPSLGSTINNDNDDDGSMLNCITDPKRAQSNAENTSLRQHQEFKLTSAVATTTRSHSHKQAAIGVNNSTLFPVGIFPPQRNHVLSASSNTASNNTTLPSSAGSQVPSSVVASTANAITTHRAPTSKENPSNSHSNSTSNNSRYLRHYTEACFICDRRFKSIKWLQSHVMNDHKNEVGNLVGLIVQVLLGNGNVAPNAGSTNAALSGGANVGSGISGSSLEQTLSASLAGVGGLSASLAAGLAGASQGASLMGVMDLQQVAQRQQLQNSTTRATPTATKD